MRTAVLGAGHAGIEAAKAIRAGGGEVVIFSNEPVLPYYRPRLVAVAFGQAEFSTIQVKPQAWYEQQLIDLRLNEAILTVDPRQRKVVTARVTETFDGLIVANGGMPVLPRFAADGGEFIWPLWSLGHAVELRRRIGAGKRLVIIGGGILGIEAALHADEAGMSVTIVEQMDRLMPSQFGSRASSVLKSRLESRGIHVLLGANVTGAHPLSASVVLALEEEGCLEAELCLGVLALILTYPWRQPQGWRTVVAFLSMNSCKHPAPSVMPPGM